MNESRDTVIQWVVPTSPLRTGIANYTGDFFRAVDGRWPIQVFPEPGSKLGLYRSIRNQGDRDPDPSIPLMTHIGNSEFHARAFQLALQVSGVLVLHDVVLHHALAAYLLRTGRSRDYWRELDSRYGRSGVEFGRALLGGRNATDIEAYPLCEAFVENARVTVVHSSYAAEAVRRLVPNAEIRVVPMGIPVPAVVSQHVARQALGIPASAFVVVSISHVNPNKRIQMVLRALRRLVARTKDVVFVIAGSGSDSSQLMREIRILGLEPHVVQLGYVDDRTARLLAAAADACVNLRYPTTGETSASLLRLLGVGLPVLVSEAGTSLELPAGVGLRIPVDEYEVEMISDVLRELATNKQFREDAGLAARAFVLANHTMADQVNGFRRVLQEYYGVDLPGLDHVPTEDAPVIGEVGKPQVKSGSVTDSVVDAISGLGLGNQDSVITAAATAITELGLVDRRSPAAGIPRERLLARIACPECGGSVGDEGRCRVCAFVVPRDSQLLDLR
ncbi:glycosyltransferase family 4 protein [soil metagenome]